MQLGKLMHGTELIKHRFTQMQKGGVIIVLKIKFFQGERN